MKKIHKNILYLTLLLMPMTVKAEEYIICGNEKKIPTVFGTMISTLYVIVRILVPILLIASGIFTFFKVIIANKVDESLDKAKKKLVTNIIAAIVIFFIASIINIVISLAAGRKNSFNSCMYCMIHPDKCTQTNAEITKLCPGLISDQDKYNDDCTLKDETKPGERVDYSTGNTGVSEYTKTVASAGGGAVARSLIDNPDAVPGEKIIHEKYNNINYYVYIPQRVESSKPLIVYLHGRGGTGTMYQFLKSDGGGGFLHEIEDKNVEYNSYILMPQTPIYEWNTNTVMSIINEVVNKYGIDTKRISIWGYSMGAEAIPAIVNSNPNFFSSAVLIAKGFDADVSGFATVPTYGFYRLGDPYGAVTNTPKVINKIKKIGKAYIKQYPAPPNNENGHAYMPNIVLEDTDIGNGYSTIMDWVLDQRRTD